ncbi:alpha/beta-hydrolase [Haematococcus lacustris]
MQNASLGKKLKLLCLHGYTQNAETFSSRIGSLRKALKSRCDFVFVDAPFPSTGLPGSDDADEAQGLASGGRSWWQWADVGSSARPSLAEEYKGWPDALSELVAAIRQHQPDGVLGFSQGATAAALLLADLQQPPSLELLQGVTPPGFTICIAGFVPRDAEYAARLSRRPVAVPCLMVYGEADQLVPEERCRALAACFQPDLVRVYGHPGAHMVPSCSGAFKQALLSFLDERHAEVAAKRGQS